MPTFRDERGMDERGGLFCSCAVTDRLLSACEPRISAFGPFITATQPVSQRAIVTHFDASKKSCSRSR